MCGGRRTDGRSSPFFHVHQRVFSGGERGIRTLDTGFGPYAPLAGECLRPLGHLSDLCSTYAKQPLREGLCRSRLRAISASLARSLAGSGPACAPATRSCAALALLAPLVEPSIQVLARM